MNKKILLIEDNLEVRENTAEILELANYDVLTAVNGKEGVKLAHSKLPDVIICDIMMPELDGYGVLHVLGKSPETASIPFIFLTAKAEKSDYRKGMGMGADDYVTKPFDDNELLDAIEARLRRNEILKSEYSKNAEGFNDFINEAKGLIELKKLSEHRDSKHFNRKSEIYREGGFPRAIYMIEKGKVKTFKSSEDGKEYITKLYGEGDFFGYSTLLEESTYSETAEAIEDSEIIVIPSDDFFSLILNNRDVAHRFIKMLSNNLKEQEERLLHLAYNSVRKRVAEALLMLQERYKKDDNNTFSMAIAREDIASIVGTATESVIRTLSDFKAEKLIEIHGSGITIINQQKLKMLRS